MPDIESFPRRAKIIFADYEACQYTYILKVKIDCCFLLDLSDPKL